jgi:protein gp37
VGGIHNPRGFFNAKHWQKPYEWNRKAKKAGRRDRVFCASMADVFEKHQDGETNVMMEAARFHLFQAIEATPNLIWLLLTKRPENIVEMVPANWNKFNYPKNICLMTSAEDQKRANERIRCLVNVPAVVHHGLSLEPLLGPINLKESIDGLGLIDWVIVGGESGPGARPMHPEWARDLRDQCVGADIPFFFKQWGNWVHAGDNRFAPDEGRVEWFDLGDDDGAIPMRNVGKKKAGRLLDGRFWNEHPFNLKAEVVEL